NRAHGDGHSQYLRLARHLKSLRARRNRGGNDTSEHSEVPSLRRFNARKRKTDRRQNGLLQSSSRYLERSSQENRRRRFNDFRFTDLFSQRGLRIGSGKGVCF